MVEAITNRVRSAGRVFTWGEDARLAAALASLAARSDTDVAAFRQWIAQLREDHKSIWNGPLDVTRYVAERAQLNVLAELVSDLDALSLGASSREIRDALVAARRQLG